MKDIPAVYYLIDSVLVMYLVIVLAIAIYRKRYEKYYYSLFLILLVMSLAVYIVHGYAHYDHAYYDLRKGFIRATMYSAASIFILSFFNVFIGLFYIKGRKFKVISILSFITGVLFILFVYWLKNALKGPYPFG
jgi:hypothetical protein